jgi:hypothetical protein
VGRRGWRRRPCKGLVARFLGSILFLGATTRVILGAAAARRGGGVEGERQCRCFRSVTYYGEYPKYMNVTRRDR